MRRLERATVVDEGTSDRPYFIVVGRPGGSSAGNVRFSRRENALRVSRAINKAYEDEARLWNGEQEEN